jgi:hypothetical protein
VILPRELSRLEGTSTYTSSGATTTTLRATTTTGTTTTTEHFPDPAPDGDDAWGDDGTFS